MKRMRIAALGVAVMAMASLAQAQAPQASDSGRAHGRGEMRGEMRGERGPGGRRGGPMGMLMQGSTLSDAQRTQARTIADQYRDRMQALRGDRQRGERPDSATMVQMRALMVQEQAELRAVLTPEQQKQFDANVATMEQRMKERRERGDDRRPERSGSR